MTDPMKTKEIEEWLALAKNASRGPWHVHYSMGSGDFHWIVDYTEEDFNRVAKVEVCGPSTGDIVMAGTANAAFIAAAREGWPSALHEVQRLRKFIDNSQYGNAYLNAELAAKNARIEELEEAYDKAADYIERLEGMLENALEATDAG